MNISRHILNEAIDMSLEWGNLSYEKLSSRIKGQFPELSKDDALKIEKLCDDIIKYAKNKSKSSSSIGELGSYISERFNFINTTNIENISRQAWFWNLGAR